MFKIFVRFTWIFIAFICITPSLQAQKDLPQDYLPASFHAGRRAALREKMPDSSVTVVFAFPMRNFSNDVDYNYHANPDFYYFSGYKEPNSVLLIFKEEQKDADGSAYSEIIFVQKRDAQEEQWTGRRLGVEGVKEKLGINKAYNGEAFKDYKIDFSQFSKILFAELPTDVANTRNRADLYDLIEQFKVKAGITPETAKTKRYDNNAYNRITGALREIKTPEEIVLLRKAVEISCQGQNEVMKALRPDMSEMEIQGIHEFVHKKYGAEGVGYGSIIGAGANGCILHYWESTKTKVGKELVLMDVGAEYHGYTADVTRTIPASGKFSPEEKIIYQLVYDAQEAAFKTLKDGSTWSAAETAARNIITDGLLKLGVIKDKREARKYFPHGLGHHLGLDVHDRSNYGTLKKDMVITIEPGIYIPEGSDCDKKWWNIAVRIEDDALITQDGFELLSKFAPRSIAEIEKLMSQKSALDNFKLPPLKSAEKKGF